MSVKRILATLILSILILGATAYVFQSYAAPEVEITPVQPRQEKAIQSVVQADGIIMPIRSVALGFNVAGRVATVNVVEGSTVKQGTVLARLDDSILQKQLAQAQAALELAQKQLQQLQAGATPDQFASATADLDAAQQNYGRIKEGPTAAQISQLKAQLDTTQAAVKQAQAAYDRAGGATNPGIGQTQEVARLQQATNAYAAAFAAYNEAISHPTDAELAGAYAQVQRAQKALDELTPPQAALQVAQAQVDNAQASLALLQAQQKDYVLLAPFDGTIASRGVEVGQLVQAGVPAFVLGDLSQLQVRTTDLTLADAPRVRPGAPVHITCTELPGKTFQGTVAQILPRAGDSSGSPAFQVNVELASTQDSDLKWGMVTRIEIAVNQ